MIRCIPCDTVYTVVIPPIQGQTVMPTIRQRCSGKVALFKSRSSLFKHIHTMAYIPPAESVKREFLRSAENRDQKGEVLNSTFTLHLTDEQIDQTNTFVAAETLVMNEPQISDFFFNGKPAGVVDDIRILEGWIFHIDDLIEKAENESGTYHRENNDIYNIYSHM